MVSGGQHDHQLAAGLNHAWSHGVQHVIAATDSRHKDHLSGLANMADTNSNHLSPSKHTHPYLSAMVNNGSLAYDHNKDGSLTSIGGCEVRFRNLQHETWIAIR